MRPRQAKHNTAEHRRLAESPTDDDPWRLWGPYVAGRQWGTVREDYSADGDAWASFPFDQAHTRAYRWGEDGIAGISDDQQRLCLALALWNEQDPILKERAFGLTNSEATARRLAVVWGVHPLRTQDATSMSDMVAKAVRAAQAEGFAGPGDEVVVTAGVPFGQAGTTLRIWRLRQVPETYTPPEDPGEE